MRFVIAVPNSNNKKTRCGFLVLILIKYESGNYFLFFKVFQEILGGSTNI